LSYYQFFNYNNSTTTSTTVGFKKSDKSDFHAYVKEHLGGFYMHYYRVGYGTHLQLEDALAALRAYIVVDDDDDDYKIVIKDVDDDNLNYNEA